MTNKMTNKDVAKKVVDRIVEEIKNGATLPWVKPWGAAENTITVQDGVKTVTLRPVAWRRNGKEYKGSNTYLPVGEYITWSECHKEGGRVKAGAHSWPVVYWNFVKKAVTTTDPDTGEETTKTVTIPFLKYYLVFNVKDCEGIKQKHSPKPRTFQVPVYHTEHVENDGTLDDTAEAIVDDYVQRAGNGFRIDRNEVSDEAYYHRLFDYVNVPCRKQFQTASEYYSTLFHELGHSTGHETRLNRFSGDNKIAAWGDENYSREELVAETTAATILNALGMEEANTFRNSAAYIEHWASHISADPMMYITAATRAQAAVDLILGIQDDAADGDQE